MEMPRTVAATIIEHIKSLSWYHIIDGNSDIRLCIYNKNLDESFVLRLENIMPKKARHEREHGVQSDLLTREMGLQPIERVFFDETPPAEAGRIKKEITEIMEQAHCITRESALRQLGEANAVIE